MSHLDWNSDWFPLPGVAVFDRDKQHVAAVSRAPGILDLFVIGFDNRIWTTYWTERGGWNADWFPLPGAAVFDRDKQRVAAVSRSPGNLDLFVVGFDNRVWTTYWTEAGGWNADWFPLPGVAVFDRERQHVSAVSRAPGNLDLFIVGFDNRVWTTYWNQAGGWSADWFPLPGTAVFDRERQHVAVVSRAAGNLDLFIVGFDNRVWSTYWSQAGGWSANWFPLPGAAVFDRSKQHVEVVSRAPGNLDLFIIGLDNRVWTTYWNQAGGWSADWFALPGEAAFDRDTQHVAAVARSGTNLDLFVIGFDNRVWSTYWMEAEGWAPDWLPLPGQVVFDRHKQRVAAVTRRPDRSDLFVLGRDNRIWTTYGGALLLQFRLRQFSEHESTDGGLQGASDEVYVSAVGIDPQLVRTAPDGNVVAASIDGPVIGDVSEDAVRRPWMQNPYVLLEFDLGRRGEWPRTYALTLLVVEHDNQDLAEVFAKLKAKVGEEARAAVIAAATSLGVVIGTVVTPGVGTVVGAAVGFLAGLAWDEVIPAIGDGLANEVFTPRTLSLQIPSYPAPGVEPPAGAEQATTLRIEEHGAIYDVVYDWHLVRQ